MKEVFLFSVAIAVATIVSVAGVDTPIKPVPTKCPKENSMGYTVHLAHEWDCTKFYMCNWGEKVEMDCPPRDPEGNKLWFNKVLQVCDWPKDSGCVMGKPGKTTTEKPITTTKTTTTTTTEPTTTTTTTTTEPTTTTTTTTTEPTTTTTEPTSTTDPDDYPNKCKNVKHKIKIPHPTDCKLYYICDGKGGSKLKKCDDDMAFDPTSLMCDWDFEGICDQKPAEEPKPNPKPQPPKRCPEIDDPNNPVMFPHECQCRAYYTCKQGSIVWERCAKEEGYHPQQKKCIRGYKSPGCKESPEMDDEILEIKNDDPSQCVGTCSAQDFNDNGVISENKNCARFCKCVDGTFSIYVCPSGQEFNPKSRKCVHPTESECRFKPSAAANGSESNFFLKLFHWGK